MPDTTRISIKLGQTALELEGTETFVSSQLERLTFLLTPSQRGEEPPPGSNEGVRREQAEVEGEIVVKPKKPRSSTGGGQGCSTKIEQLRKSGFFKSPKTTQDVGFKLREQANPYPSNKISAVLMSNAKHYAAIKKAANGFLATHDDVARRLYRKG